MAHRVEGPQLAPSVGVVPREALEVLEAMAHGVDRPQLAPSVGAVPRAGTPAKQTSGM